MTAQEAIPSATVAFFHPVGYSTIAHKLLVGNKPKPKHTALSFKPCIPLLEPLKSWVSL